MAADKDDKVPAAGVEKEGGKKGPGIPRPRPKTPIGWIILALVTLLIAWKAGIGVAILFLLFVSGAPLFTIYVAYLLYKSGMHQREHVGGTVKQFIDDKTVVTMMPIGAALISLHCVLHIIIDADYLARGKTPPEKARTGH